MYLEGAAQYYNSYYTQLINQAKCVDIITDANSSIVDNFIVTKIAQSNEVNLFLDDNKDGAIDNMQQYITITPLP